MKKTNKKPTNHKNPKNPKKPKKTPTKNQNNLTTLSLAPFQESKRIKYIPRNIPFAETSKKTQKRSLKINPPRIKAIASCVQICKCFWGINVRFYFVLCQFLAVYHMHSIAANIR